MPLRTLQLNDYRNFETLTLEIEAQIVAFYGDNGAGKTNLLESLSLFTQGRNLRKADAKSLVKQGSETGYSVFIRMDDGASVASGLRMEEGVWVKKLRINETSIKSAQDFSQLIRPLWLTPAMDGLFVASPGERRRYIDRMVLTLDPEHGARVQGYERALASRNKLLSEHSFDALWLQALEKDIVERGVAIVAARQDLISRLNFLIETKQKTSFPNARLALEGDIDTQFLCLSSCVDLEDWFAKQLQSCRNKDKYSGRTSVGPHTSDLYVHHCPKDMPAALCSTGEQKALLIGLMLAHAQLVSELSPVRPILLLDEIAAHLDPDKRLALFDELERLNLQTFMTGTDAMLFEGLGEGAQICEVKMGQLL